MISSRKSGTSLVEILVVIVVFLVGILAIVQLFPGGFKALQTAQKNSIATALGRAQMEMLKSHADQLPDQIAPVQYTYNGGQITISLQPERSPNDLGPAYNNMDSTGTMFDAAANPIGNWQYLTGPNIGRRVIGEGKVIPTPRVTGAYFGSLLTLQFAPLVFNPSYTSLFVVFGNDMYRHEGDPNADNVQVRSSDFYVSNEDTANAVIWLPQNPTKDIDYQLAMSVYVNNGGPVQRQDFVSLTAHVLAGNGWYQVPVGLGGVNPPLLSLTIAGIDYDSVKVQRRFADVSALPNDDWGLGSGIPNPDPYEYKLLSPQLGLVLFNPSGYNYLVRGTGGRRTPLLGRASYDVFDWRIVHDEFRAANTFPIQYRLALGGLKVTSESGPDGRPNQGIGIQSPDWQGNLQNVDLVLQDVDTGGLFVFQEGTSDPTRTCYTVNKSLGLITMLDNDGDPSNGTQAMLLYPGESVPRVVTVNGRSIRALYMGKSEWAVQVLKPAATYSEAWGRPGIGNFYIAGSQSGDGSQSSSRIYFPPADTGRVVSLGEVYFFDTSGAEIGPIQLTAKVESAIEDGTWGGQLPYIDVRAYYPDFQTFDYNYASAVKSVKGASVAVRVLWNPDYFTLTTDAPTNMDHLEKWMQGWRRSTAETYLQRGY